MPARSGLGSPPRSLLLRFNPATARRHCVSSWSLLATHRSHRDEQPTLARAFDPQFGTTPYAPSAAGGRPVSGDAKYGKIGTAIAAVSLLLSVLAVPVINIVMHGGDYSAWNSAHTIVTFALAAVDVVILLFGLAGLRNDRVRLFAGIALGVGGFGILSFVLGYIPNITGVFL